MNEFSDLSGKLKDLLDGILSSSSCLIEELKQDGAIIYTPGFGEPGIDYVKSALEDLWYKNDGDGRYTNSYIAVVQCSERCILKVKEINELKSLFAEVKLEIDNKSKKLFKECTASYLNSPDVRKRLRCLGASRLNINHIRRKIPLFTGEINKISYSRYTKGKSIEKITPKQAEDKLKKLNSAIPEHIQTQLNLLGNHPHSVELVEVKSIAPTIKVNIGHPNGVETICPPLPIFISDLNVNKYMITFTPSDHKPRKKRSDTKIEDTPFLPSIHVYRKSL